ncbi:MAG: hypothetical protein COX63_03510 [Candidatus Diapherotrites archaeon CG_4_10_14_0_2_um_filter_31_5]|nr:MAG: hypothetical protein COX63_03510 [Candidatus Diapherotrites archaeon CG_4_10_14_0_2_um_filter_31_5]
MSMDFELILKNGFAWRKEQRVWLYIFLLIVLGLGFLIASAFLVEEAISEFLAAYISSGDIATAVFSLIGTIVLIILAFIGVAFIQSFIYTLILLKGMNFYKMKTISFGLIEFIKLLVLYFFSFIAATISYYNKKFLLFFVGLIAVWLFGFAALFVVPALGALLMIVGIVLWIPYFFIILYNSFRLSMSPFVFLEQGNIFGSLKKSYEITAGKVIEIFLAILIVSVIMGIIVFIANQLGQAMLYAVFPELNGLQEMALQSESNPLMVLGLINSLLENAAEMIIVGGILSTIVNAIMNAFSAYSYAGIYFQVKKK